MKVRHKADHSLIKEAAHVIESGGLGVYLFEDKTWVFTDNWEPVPSEPWRDVTGECKSGDTHFVRWRDEFAAKALFGYRLRKVPAAVFPGELPKLWPNGVLPVDSSAIGYAFIIEKKEPA